MEYNSGSLVQISNEPHFTQSIGTVLNDFVEFLPDSAKLQGALIQPVTLALQAYREAGEYFLISGNHFTQVKNPNIVSIAADGDSSTPMSYTVLLSNETIASTGTTTFPKQYDVAGVPTALTGNRATIHYLFAFGSTNFLQMGQGNYVDASTAVNNAQTDLNNFDFVDGLSDAVLLAQIVIGNNAADFTDPARAQILNLRGGSGGGSGGGGGAANLQEAYEGGSTILTDNTENAVVIQRGSTSDTDTIFEGKNGAGSITFSVDGEGDVVGRTFAGDGSLLTNILTTGLADEAVTNPKLANMASQTIKGRNTAGTGDPEDLTATQVRTILNVSDGAEANTIDSDPTGVAGADQVINVMSLTQAEYDAIGSPDPATFFIITDA
ncbi:MAG: phage upper tail fiber protein [Planctomycetota bacterium]